jgi:hypothetical protein
MNEFLKKWALLLLILLVALAVFVAKKCCPDDSTAAVTFDKSPIKAPHAVALIDANSAAARNVEKARVTIIDPDGMVVSSNGYKFENVEVIGGVMSIGLSSQASFSVEKPYRFFIRVEADGYMTNLKTVVVTQDVPNYVPIYLANLAALPSSGLSANVAAAAVVQDGAMSEALTLQTSTGAQMLRVIIPQGAKLLCDGKPLEGRGRTLSYQLLAGNPLDSSANRVFPGGFEVTDALNSAGEPFLIDNERAVSAASPVYFTSAGWFSLNLNLDSEAVNGFDVPVKVEMPVARDVRNPATGASVMVGDQVPLWNLDNRTGVWRNEGTGAVEDAGNGQMKVTFETKHFSTWNLDFFSGGCPGSLTIGYDAALTGPKFTRLVYPASGVEVKTSLIDFSAGGGSPLTLLRLPNTTDRAKLMVHDGADASFPVIRLSDDIQSCACVAPPCSLRVFGAPASCATLRFQVGATATSPCNNSVWYKSAAADPLFTLGGVLNASGEVSVASLSATKPVRLWYYDYLAGVQVALDFPINFSGTGALSGTVTITRGVAAPTTQAFNYSIAALGACGKTITVTIPAGIISDLTGCK